MSDPMVAIARPSDMGGDATTPLHHADIEPIIAMASRAPSIHNTQPWSWQLHPFQLSLRVDRGRQLRIADPDGHSLLISCGAAVTLTELGLRTLGRQVRTRRLPDPGDPDVVAVFTLGAPEPASVHELELLAAAQRRQSDRRPFSSQEVPSEVVEVLRDAAAAPGVHADFPIREEQRVNLAVAVGWADRTETRDPEYLAEMNHWLRESNVSTDGIPAGAVPHLPAGKVRHTEVPLRDFEVGVSGRLLIERDVDERPLIAVLLTGSDTAVEQLRAGEAMMRLMLEAELLGLGICPLSQAVDLVAFRNRIQTLMSWQGLPQMILRIGYPANGARPERTPRRPVADVLKVLPG